MPAPSVAALTGLLFGASAAVGGAATLAQPQRAHDFLGLAAAPLRAGSASSVSAAQLTRGLGLAGVATGAYYLLAAWQDNRAFLVLSAPLRLATAAVLWREGSQPLRGLALWQASGALATVLGLLVDSVRGGGGGGDDGPTAAASTSPSASTHTAKTAPRKDKHGGGAADSDEVRETEGSETESRRRKLGGRSRFGRRSGKKRDEA